MSIINREYLNLNNFKDNFHSSGPYPHLVMDNFLDKRFFDKLNLENDIARKNKGKRFQTQFEKNKWISKNTQLPKKIRKIIYELNEKKWIRNISKLTKIDKVFTTKVSNTDLANYHEMKNNGYLGPHVDHSDDPDTGHPHVLNLLLYLSKQWKQNYGGSTLLYDEKGRKIIKEIQYKPNRAILFLHTPYSFHGVKKIKKNNIIRSSIYVDYYSKSVNPYDNINLNFSKKWFKHGTCFVYPKFSDFIKIQNIKYTKTYLKYRLKQILTR